MEVLGRDLLEYFIKETNRRLEDIDKKLDEYLHKFDEKYTKRLDEVDKQIEELNAWRWKSIGALIVFNGAIALLIEVVRR